MQHQSTRRHLLRSLGSLRSPLTWAAGLAVLAPGALAQAEPTFSVDPLSSSAGGPDCTGALTVRTADVLMPATGGGKPELAAPSPVCIAIRGGGGAGTLGLSMPLVANVDALSYGNDAPLQQQNNPRGSLWFSVNRSAVGLLSPISPSVNTEAVCSEQPNGIFIDTGLPAFPTIWNAGAGRNVLAIDGNGLASCSGYTAPGVGLVDVDGDDLDALDVDGQGSRVLFSLDGSLTDPCSGATGNGSAAALGYQPGAILASNLSGAAPITWATPNSLGLDLGGAGTDDLDALAVWDNGNGTYDPPDVFMGWLNGGADMVLFSVREGSWVIGRVDSLTGSPIEPGDVLIPPIPNGVSPFPAILVPAEALGLATRRSGNGYQCFGGMTSDELDALDTTDVAQMDCNGNGIDDAIDILQGEPDTNKNGVPDSCESSCGQIVTYCTAGTTSSGCNPTLSATGTASLSNAGPFVLAASGVEGNKNGIFFYGISGRAASPWGNSTSWLCVKAPSQRMAPPMGSGGTAGACDGSFSRDWNAYVAANPAKPINLALTVGTLVDAQAWFRDPAAGTGPVGAKGTALSEAIEFPVCP